MSSANRFAFAALNPQSCLPHENPFRRRRFRWQFGRIAADDAVYFADRRFARAVLFAAGDGVHGVRRVCRAAQDERAGRFWPTRCLRRRKSACPRRAARERADDRRVATTASRAARGRGRLSGGLDRARRTGKWPRGEREARRRVAAHFALGDAARVDYTAAEQASRRTVSCAVGDGRFRVKSASWRGAPPRISRPARRDS